MWCLFWYPDVEAKLAFLLLAYVNVFNTLVGERTFILQSQITGIFVETSGKIETIISNVLRIHRNYAERASTELMEVVMQHL